MTGLPSIENYPLPNARTLPANVAEWSLSSDRAVLLIHDMQGYFLDALPSPLRSELVHNASTIRKRCLELGVPVAYTAQPGRMTEQERGLLRHFWGPGMRSADADLRIVPELAPSPSDQVFTKWRYSAFFRSGLLESMRENGRDQLILCGVYAHIGVLMSAVDAFTNDIQPFLAADAVGDFSAAHHRMALEYAAQRCGMVLATQDVFA
jgi:trans-2,3-dihydro-3-hydroxyanthranilic acid synthase